MSREVQDGATLQRIIPLSPRTIGLSVRESTLMLTSRVLPMTILRSPCFVLLLALSSTDACAGETIEPNDLIRQVALAASRYEEFARHLVIRATHTSTLKLTSEITMKSMVDIKTSGPHCLLKFEWLVLNRDKSNVAPPYVLCSNSKYSFNLRRRFDDDKWAVASIKTHTTPDEKSPITVETKRYADDYLRAPYTVMMRDYMPALLGDQKTEVLSTGREKLAEGTSVVRIRLKRDNELFDILVDPESNMCVRKATCEGPAGAVFSQEFEYLTNNRGYPILKGFSYNILPADNKKHRTITAIYEVSEHTGLDESEFAISNFGLPEPAGSEIRTNSRIWWWIVAFLTGLVLIALPRLLRRFKR